MLTITEEAKMKGWFDCSRTDGEVVKARHTGKGTKILHENDDKTKGIISYQYDVYSRRKEGANKKQEMMDSFLDSFVEDKNGTLYKVKFTKSRRGNAYTIHSTDEVVVLDGKLKRHLLLRVRVTKLKNSFLMKVSNKMPMPTLRLARRGGLHCLTRRRQASRMTNYKTRRRSWKRIWLVPNMICPL